MTYLVHINPTPGKDDRVVEVEADSAQVVDGVLFIADSSPIKSFAIFAPGIWNYMEPKK